MKHQKTLFTIFLLLGVGVLSIQAYIIWPRHDSGDTLVTPTQEINDSQSIGGVAVAPTKASGTESEDTADESTIATDKTSAPPKLEEVAPRHAEIKRAVTTEYLYRALLTSNDPFPQPTWSTNATKTHAAWDASTGNGVAVAVIDSGFGLAHEDLVNQWYVNPGETGMTVEGETCWSGSPSDKRNNGCDDDGNGYDDDWRGWDFVSYDNNPQAGDTNPNGDGVAHGTEVAGLVGATGNNGVGTASVSWNNSIMPLQALDDDGSGYTSGVTAAVYYAVDNGAKVINMSLGGVANDVALATAVRYAYEQGVVVVAAAGNCGTGNESGCDPSQPGAMSYPALNPHVIAVGATTSSNVRASFSSYGPGIDVVAPGSGTLVSPMWQSANQTSAYATSLYGTSFSSPIVASYIGLLKSLRPASTVDDITALVDATASKLPAMSGKLFTPEHGHGMIDAQAGLRVASNLNQASSTPVLLQAGDHRSERMYNPSSTLGSGCRTVANTYCTVGARNSAGFDRYLPYNLTDSEGQSGWTWSGGWLGDGEWFLRARNGNQQSTTPYILINR